MSLYRFEIKAGQSTKTIEVECDGIENIRAEALKLAKNSVHDLQADFWDQPLWALRVTDHSNMSILSLTLTAG